MLAGEQFDLVLLDVEMPEMDGVAVLKQMATQERLLAVPVIMTSALDEVERIAECIALGADDFLSKPVNVVLLNARVLGEPRQEALARPAPPAHAPLRDRGRG